MSVDSSNEHKGGTAIPSHPDPVPSALDRATAGRPGGFWLAATSRLADLTALAVLVLTIIVGARDMLLDPVRAGLDTLTFFWPTYAFLGEQLRSGNVPGWNPYQFSGVPFAADAESGWMYAPAMLIFTLLPLATAFKVYAVAHILIAGFGTYVYGRLIGLIPVGALVSAWAVSQGGLFSDRSRCCYAHIQVAAWIPITLLGVEIAVRASRHRPRMLAWLLSGFAISQLLAGWIGQGAMYGLMLFGAYVLFRSAVYPPGSAGSARTRLVQAAQHGLIPLLIGVGVAAPGILPRLGYYNESNLSGGYSGSSAWAAQLGGWTFGRQLELLLDPSGWFIGALIFALSLLAIVHSRTRGYVSFFLVLTITGFVLGLESHTPLHEVLFALLPVFEEMHTHFPERVALIFLFGPAMLSGFGLAALVRHPNTTSLMTATVVFGIAAVGLSAVNLDLRTQTWIAIAGAIVLLSSLALTARLQQTALYCIIAVVMLASVLIELQTAAWTHARDGNYARVETASLIERNQTAEFIMAGDPVVPPRFFGYDPALTFVQHGEITYYRHDFQNVMTSELLVNNRGTLWGLADIQGYNPLQLNGYVAYMTALNGAPQEYHGSYVLPSGLDSPLLRLLAAQFIVVPLVIPHDRPDLLALVDRYPQVATTPHVRILRFTDAFPRAWIVHEVQQFDGDLGVAVSGNPIDFRQVALVEDEAVPLDAPGGTLAESAIITGYEPDRLSLEVTSDGDGLLVLSETYAEGWTSSIDGNEAEVIAVNGALRGVPIPGGKHTVELSFEPPGLRVGAAVGIATIMLTIGGLTVATALDRRSARAPASEGGRRD